VAWQTYPIQCPIPQPITYTAVTISIHPKCKLTECRANGKPPFVIIDGLQQTVLTKPCSLEVVACGPSINSSLGGHRTPKNCSNGPFPRKDNVSQRRIRTKCQKLIASKSRKHPPSQLPIYRQQSVPFRRPSLARDRQP
jgi:hypothetical protein